MSYYTINNTGIQTILDFILAQASRPQSINAWMSEAEQIANDALPGEAIILEMPSRSTISGRPETLQLNFTHFDQTDTEG